MPGLNNAEVKVVEVPRHEYQGRDILTQARDAAIERYTTQSNDKKRELKSLHYDNLGETFDYVISPKSLTEAANHAGESDNIGVHVAVMDRLDKVITKQVKRVFDIMLRNHLRNQEADFASLTSMRGSRVDARGIQVQGELDADGQMTLSVFNRAKGLKSNSPDEQAA